MFSFYFLSCWFTWIEPPVLTCPERENSENSPYKRKVSLWKGARHTSRLSHCARPSDTYASFSRFSSIFPTKDTREGSIKFYIIFFSVPRFFTIGHYRPCARETGKHKRKFIILFMWGRDVLKVFLFYLWPCLLKYKSDFRTNKLNSQSYWSNC